MRFLDNRLINSAPYSSNSSSVEYGYELTPCEGRAITCPPGMSMLPVIAQRQMMACATAVPSGLISIGTPQWIAACFAFATKRAAATISLAGTSVIADTGRSEERRVGE